jgi:purine-binding chemotaxis protein CheW
LRARARVLARVPKRKPGGAHLDVIAFRLADETYAIETAYIREVFSLRDLTLVPGTPPFVLGIINVRGQIQTVIDLKQFLALPVRGLSEHPKVILLHGAGMEVGLLADSIEGARRIVVAEIQTALPAMLGATGDYMRGVTNERLVILDVPQVLAAERLLVNDD